LAQESDDTIIFYRLQGCQEEHLSLAESKRIDIWVVRPDGKIAFSQSYPRKKAPNGGERDNVAPAALADSMRGREPLQSDSMRSLRRQWASYYDLLVTPIAEYLPRDPNARIIIVPDRDMILVPFYLLGGVNAPSLIDAHTLEFVPSLRVLRYLQSRSANAPPFDWANIPAAEVLVVGNPTMPRVPDFGGSNGVDGKLPTSPLQPLPGAESEARAVASLFRTYPILGPEATGINIKARLQSARLIHLATHGVLSNSYITAVRFAEPNPPINI
jgi:CHAT domain-containing protein